MKHIIHHGLDTDTAKKVSQKAIDAYCARFAEYNPKFSWASETSTKGDLSFKARGLDIKGTVEIVGDTLVLDMKVPFLARMFMKPAIKVINAEVAKWVQAAKEGKLDL